MPGESEARCLIDITEVARRTGRSVRQCWSDVSRGVLPAPCLRRPRLTRWDSDAIAEYIRRVASGELDE